MTTVRGEILGEILSQVNELSGELADKLNENLVNFVGVTDPPLTPEEISAAGTALSSDALQKIRPLLFNFLSKDAIVPYDPEQAILVPEDFPIVPQVRYVYVTKIEVQANTDRSPAFWRPLIR